MKTIDYLNIIRTKFDCSDYRAAQLLEINKSSTSRYRNKKGTFDDVTALRAGTLLGVDPRLVLIDMQAERCQNKSVQETWHSIRKEISHANH